MHIGACAGAYHHSPFSDHQSHCSLPILPISIIKLTINMLRVKNFLESLLQKCLIRLINFLDFVYLQNKSQTTICCGGMTLE